MAMGKGDQPGDDHRAGIPRRADVPHAELVPLEARVGREIHKGAEDEGETHGEHQRAEEVGEVLEEPTQAARGDARHAEQEEQVIALRLGAGLGRGRPRIRSADSPPSRREDPRVGLPERRRGVERHPSRRRARPHTRRDERVSPKPNRGAEDARRVAPRASPLVNLRPVVQHPRKPSHRAARRKHCPDDCGVDISSTTTTPLPRACRPRTRTLAPSKASLSTLTKRRGPSSTPRSRRVDAQPPRRGQRQDSNTPGRFSSHLVLAPFPPLAPPPPPPCAPCAPYPTHHELIREVQLTPEGDGLDGASKHESPA